MNSTEAIQQQQDQREDLSMATPPAAVAEKDIIVDQPSSSSLPLAYPAEIASWDALDAMMTRQGMTRILDENNGDEQTVQGMLQDVEQAQRQGRASPTATVHSSSDPQYLIQNSEVTTSSLHAGLVQKPIPRRILIAHTNIAAERARRMAQCSDVAAELEPALRNLQSQEGQSQMIESPQSYLGADLPEVLDMLGALECCAILS